MTYSETQIKLLHKLYNNDLPASCNMCPLMCHSCERVRWGDIKNPPNMELSKCVKCCSRYIEVYSSCIVVGRRIRMCHKPSCNKYMIIKTLLEAL